MERWLWCVLALASWFAGRTQGRLLVTINEPSGPFTASGTVILQTESPRNITVVTAHTYEISCSSNIGVTPVWRHNGSSVMSSPPISGTPGVYVRGPANQERVLVLQNITQSVVGTFVCLEGNSQDADSATFIVTTGNPAAIPGFPQRDLDAGPRESRESLHALISATPPPLGGDVLWYFNGNLIVHRAPPLNILIIETNEISFPRTITTALMGTYTCVVNTTAGIGTATFRVQVRVQPSLTIIPATNVTTLVGMSITIRCTDTEGSPAPTITWIYNNDPLEPDGRITITNDTVTQTSQLTITSLRPGDIGTYRCLAVNPRGSANKEIHVNVQYAPIFSGVSGDPTTWVVGDEVLVTAHLTGSNPPFTSHKLLKDSQLVTSNRIQVTYTNSSSNFTFVIPRVMVSDEGRYTLAVINPIGVGRINFTIIVYSPPNLGEPRTTFFYGTVGRSVTLNLTIMDAKPLVQPANVSWMHNRISIFIDGNKYTQDVTPDGRLATLTIRDLNLLDAGSYRANVRHISSDAPQFRMKQLFVMEPSYPPTNLTITSDSDCSVNLSWIPPQTDPDTATANTIVIEYSQDGRTWAEVAREPASNTAVTVRLPRGREANASYQLRARSHNNKFGDGRTSDSTARFMLYPESNFPAVTVHAVLPSGPGVLQVSWMIPESACLLFTSLDVRCISPSNHQDTFHARAEALEANVSRLNPNTQYSCRVTSTLADWQGTPLNHQTISNAVQNYTYPAPPPRPSIPMEVPGKPPTLTTISVQFTLPSNHELISHYQVIVLRSSSVPNISPDFAYPYNYPFASYEDVNNNIGNSGPYIAAEIDAEMFEPTFTIGGSKERDQYNYLNDRLQPNSHYTCFLRAFPRWLRSGSSGGLGRRQASSDERQYVVFSSSDFLPVVRTAAIVTPGPDSIAPGAIAGAVTPVIIVFIICIIVVIVVVVVLVLRSSRSGKWGPPSPSVESSEGNPSEHQFSPPLGSVDTPDLVPKMNGGVELQSLDEKPPEFTPSGAIRVQEFLDHVEKFDASRQLLFQKEHDWITNNSPWYSSDASNDPLNDDKNRYSNITAFDHSRVTLTPIEGVECSDYINANYVAGYRSASEYITTQGPLDQTVDDFWRMVWEQNSATIVMLTNLVELGKAKCSQYWPSDTSPSIHGSIRVKLEHSVVLPDYTIRNLTVESLKTGESRTVLQFHYTKWPDYGTPKLAAPLLNFLKAIRKSNPENTGSIVVHCSAGVGRSGTVMAIDYCLQQIKAEGIVNVRGFVSKMREQRNYMVQTEQQYTFIHYALLEAIAYGDTSFSLSDFPTSYEQLNEVNKETERPLLEEEFDRLTTVRTMVLKSSFIQRVKLKGDAKKETAGVSDFRAHYVDSYLEPQLMVVCDGPTEDSTVKFWQMVWDEGCTYLIMLTPQDGDYHCYWPNFGSLRQYGNLIVEVEEESAEHVYTTRKLILSDAKDGVTHRVQQYQFIGWTNQFFPSVPSFVDFLCDVLKKTDSLQRKQRLLVHDIKSLGPSGIFCSLYYCVERVRLERMVDVFQAVQKMQLQRPGMVESVQQYAFIYDCMFEFIRTHSDSQ